MLEDRSGKDVAFLADNTQKFIEAARKRPEIAGVNTTFIASVPQSSCDVDRDKVLKQGVDLGDVYQTLQTFMGGVVNYFNRFGRHVAGLCSSRGRVSDRRRERRPVLRAQRRRQMVPLSALVTIEPTSGPEFTMRYNLLPVRPIIVSAKPGL